MAILLFCVLLVFVPWSADSFVLRRQSYDPSSSRPSISSKRLSSEQPKPSKRKATDKKISKAKETLNRLTQWNFQLPQSRGTDSVRMREAEELGGLPRGDRYNSKDWLHNTISLPNSAILKRIRSPVIAVTSWAVFCSCLHHRFSQRHLPSRVFPMFYLPLAPHSLMMNALGLLLVFRTNSAYQRFAEGRKIWENIVNIARDLSRMIRLYESDIGTEKRRRLQKLLVAFPYLLRHRIRPNLVMRRLDDQRDPVNTILLYQDKALTDNDPEAAVVAQTEEQTGRSRRKQRTLYYVDKRTLPWRLLPGKSVEQCAGAQNRPLWVCDRMAAELRAVDDSPSFSARERLVLVGYVNSLSKCIGSTERIHQTVVPLNYARHTLRALTVWLFALPFGLVKDLGFMTGPVLFVISWLLFGVYEIGCSIEDPFQGTLRLSILCDAIRRDVLGDETIRETAFDLGSLRSEAQYDDDDDDDDDKEEEEFIAPSTTKARGKPKPKSVKRRGFLPS